MPIGRPDKLKDAPAHGNSAVSDPYLYGFPNPPTGGWHLNALTCITVADYRKAVKAPAAVTDPMGGHVQLSIDTAMAASV